MGLRLGLRLRLRLLLRLRRIRRPAFGGWRLAGPEAVRWPLAGLNTCSSRSRMS